MITHMDRIDGGKYRPVNLGWLYDFGGQPVYDTEEAALRDAVKLQSRGVVVTVQKTRKKRFVEGRAEDIDDHWQVVEGAQWWLYVDRATYDRLDEGWTRYLDWLPAGGSHPQERHAKREELIRLDS